MANVRGDRVAVGRPGIEPRWTQGSKDGVGTAYAASSRIWFTVWNGVLTEVYYPTVDRPQLRDLQYLVTDGESFFHEEKRHLRQDTPSCPTALGIEYVDIPIPSTQRAPLRFTFFWPASHRWEGRDYYVAVIA